MKKLLFSILAALLPVCVMAQSDISIVFNAPLEDESTIVSGQAFNLDFEIVNAGSNAIFTGDTIFLGYSIGSQVVEGSSRYLVLTQDLGVGDSSGNLGSPDTSLSFSGLEGDAEFCILVAYGPVDDYYLETDIDKVNNTSCRFFYFTGGSNLSIKEEKDLSNAVYPNPASDIININVPEASYIIIYDFSGRAVEQAYFNNNEQKEVLLDKLSTGMYVYHLYNTTGELLLKDKFQRIK